MLAIPNIAVLRPVLVVYAPPTLVLLMIPAHVNAVKLFIIYPYTYPFEEIHFTIVFYS